MEGSMAGSSAKPASSTEIATAQAEVSNNPASFLFSPKVIDKTAAISATAKTNLLATPDCGSAAKYSQAATPSTNQVTAIADEITRRRLRLRADERLALTASSSASGGIAGRMKLGNFDWEKLKNK